MPLFIQATVIQTVAIMPRTQSVVSSLFTRIVCSYYLVRKSL